jgi:hypothetical protein
MPVSHKHQAIFVHIPRTAGSSIAQVMGVCGDDNQGTLTPVRVDMLYGLEGTKALQHLNARGIQKRLGSDVYDRYYKFTVVRNPYDRAVSEYHVRKRLMPWVKMSFKDFVMDRITQSGRFNWKSLFRSKGERALEDQFESQFDFVHDEKGKLMVDFIAKYESLEADFQKICNKLGVQGKLPVMNTSKHDDYRSYYDSDTIRRIADIYQKDLEVFKYAF